jgi:hypothetical protein
VFVFADSNWDTGTAPVDGDDIVLSAQGTYTITTDPFFMPLFGSFRVDAGAFITVTGVSAVVALVLFWLRKRS